MFFTYYLVNDKSFFHFSWVIFGFIQGIVISNYVSILHSAKTLWRRFTFATSRVILAAREQLTSMFQTLRSLVGCCVAITVSSFIAIVMPLQILVMKGVRNLMKKWATYLEWFLLLKALSSFGFCFSATYNGEKCLFFLLRTCCFLEWRPFLLSDSLKFLHLLPLNMHYSIPDWKGFLKRNSWWVWNSDWNTEWN